MQWKKNRFYDKEDDDDSFDYLKVVPKSNIQYLSNKPKDYSRKRHSKNGAENRERAEYYDASTFQKPDYNINISLSDGEEKRRIKNGRDSNLRGRRRGYEIPVVERARHSDNDDPYRKKSRSEAYNERMIATARSQRNKYETHMFEREQYDDDDEEFEMRANKIKRIDRRDRRDQLVQPQIQRDSEGEEFNRDDVHQRYTHRDRHVSQQFDFGGYRSQRDHTSHREEIDEWDDRNRKNHERVHKENHLSLGFRSHRDGKGHKEEIDEWDDRNRKDRHKSHQIDNKKPRDRKDTHKSVIITPKEKKTSSRTSYRASSRSSTKIVKSPKPKIADPIPPKKHEDPLPQMESKEESSSSSDNDDQEKPNWGRLSNKAIKEIIDTDKVYLANLRILVNNFLNPLENFSKEEDQANLNDDKEKELMLSKSDFNIIFGNVLVLIQLNENFVSELKLKIIKKNDRFFENEDDVCDVREEVSDVFIQFSPYFRMYKSYICNLPESNKIVMQLRSESSRFANFLKNVDPNVKLSLEDFLIMPMQRIPRYVLLLEQLRKYTPKKDESYEKIVKCLNIFKEIADTVNLSITEKENFNAMRNIFHQITNYPNEQFGRIIQPHRKFIRGGDFIWKDCIESPNKQVHLLLFNDIIVLASKVEEELQYLRQLKVNGCTMEVIQKSSPIEIKLIEEKSYTLSSFDMSWISEIHTAIERRKEKERAKLMSLRSFRLYKKKREEEKKKKTDRQRKSLKLVRKSSQQSSLRNERSNIKSTRSSVNKFSSLRPSEPSRENDRSSGGSLRSAGSGKGSFRSSRSPTMTKTSLRNKKSVRDYSDEEEPKSYKKSTRDFSVETERDRKKDHRKSRKRSSSRESSASSSEERRHRKRDHHKSRKSSKRDPSVSFSEEESGHKKKDHRKDRKRSSSRDSSHEERRHRKRDHRKSRKRSSSRDSSVSSSEERRHRKRDHRKSKKSSKRDPSVSSEDSLQKRKEHLRNKKKSYARDSDLEEKYKKKKAHYKSEKHSRRYD